MTEVAQVPRTRSKLIRFAAVTPHAELFGGACGHSPGMLYVALPKCTKIAKREAPAGLLNVNTLAKMNPVPEQRCRAAVWADHTRVL